jgi:hypothetical protein
LREKTVYDDVNKIYQFPTELDMNDDKIAENDKILEKIEIKEKNQDEDYIKIKNSKIEQIDDLLFNENLNENEHELQKGILQRLR